MPSESLHHFTGREPTRKLLDELRTSCDESERFFAGAFDQLASLSERLNRRQEQTHEEAAATTRRKRQMEQLIEAVEQERAALCRARQATQEQADRLATAVAEFNSVRDALLAVRTGPR